MREMAIDYQAKTRGTKLITPLAVFLTVVGVGAGLLLKFHHPRLTPPKTQAVEDFTVQARSKDLVTVYVMVNGVKSSANYSAVQNVVAGHTVRELLPAGRVAFPVTIQSMCFERIPDDAKPSPSSRRSATTHGSTEDSVGS
jgi:hypothetical protein